MFCVVDPYQGEFPETIEEYLQHGSMMKCISFNRKGTILAGKYLWLFLYKYFQLTVLCNYLPSSHGTCWFLMLCLISFFFNMLKVSFLRKLRIIFYSLAKQFFLLLSSLSNSCVIAGCLISPYLPAVQRDYLPCTSFNDRPICYSILLEHVYSISHLLTHSYRKHLLWAQLFWLTFYHYFPIVQLSPVSDMQ
jgi:hypothetical protein